MRFSIQSYRANSKQTSHPETVLAKMIKRRKGRADFFKIKTEVDTEITQGYPLSHIYDRHINGLSIGYTQFTRYVALYCKASRKAHKI